MGDESRSRDRERSRTPRQTKSPTTSVSIPLAVSITIGSMLVSIGGTYGVMNNDIEHIEHAVDAADTRNESRFNQVNMSITELTKQVTRDAVNIENQEKALLRIEASVMDIADAVDESPRRIRRR